MNGVGHSNDTLHAMVAIGAILSEITPVGSASNSQGVAIVQGTYEASPRCEHCNGAGYYMERVSFGHPHFGVLFPCVCKLAQWEAHKTDELLRLSNLAAFRDLTFATFNPKVKGVRRAFLLACEYAQQMQGWLSLFGGYGVGKTHLAAAIANEALRRDIAVIFNIVSDLLDHLRATFAPNSPVTYDERFELIRNAPLLILDDLGTESATPWAREKLYQIVNHRYNEQLPTVFTSNQEPDQIDGRIFSRMCDPRVHAQVIRITAEDYRKRDMNRAHL